MTIADTPVIYCWNHQRLNLDDVWVVAHPRHTPCCSSHDRPLCCECYCKLHFVEVNKCSPESHATAEALVRVDAYLAAVPTLYDEANPMPEGLTIDTATKWGDDPFKNTPHELLYADLVLLVDHLKGAHDHR